MKTTHKNFILSLFGISTIVYLIYSLFSWSIKNPFSWLIKFNEFSVLGKVGIVFGVFTLLIAAKNTTLIVEK